MSTYTRVCIFRCELADMEEQGCFRWTLLHLQIISVWCGFICGVCLMYEAYEALLPRALRVINMAFWTFWLLVKERGYGSEK
jgi:hypothetical protein